MFILQLGCAFDQLLNQMFFCPFFLLAADPPNSAKLAQEISSFVR